MELSPAEQRSQKIDAYSKIAVSGLSLLMTYVGLKPLLIGEPTAVKSGFSHVALEAFPMVDAMPWFFGAALISLVPFVLVMTKRIPRRVIFATRKRELVDSGWSDASAQNGIFQPAWECAASSDSRRDRKRQERV